jgi:hypothetical protein
VQTLRNWSFAKVLLVSGAWILLCLFVAAAWVLFPVAWLFTASSGSAGIGAVSVGFSELVLAIPVVPPILLILARLIARCL